jgi:long-chain acyl-CoA synthetase
MGDMQGVYVYPKMTKKPPFSIEVSGYTKKNGETIPRRNPCAKDKLVTVPSDEVTTLYENLKRSAAKFGNAKAMGWRKDTYRDKEGEEDGGWQGTGGG